MIELIKFVPLFPILGFLFLALFGSRIKNSERVAAVLASLMVFISFAITVAVFFEFSASDGSVVKVLIYEWISAGDFSVNISYQVDQLSLFFTLIITGIGFLIHIYSIGYMKGDKRFYLFFAYLNLFIFMMLNLVLSSNFLLTFLGWEGVGLASYLLIGFWYDQKFEGFRITWTGDAANKAFIVNRIGDFGFLIAMFLIFVTFGTLEYTDVMSSVMADSGALMGTGLMLAITLFMFLGCTGKSAQIPLAGWLPDAMAGPSSVSALIHAATMVTAGIFLIARNSALFALSPDTMMIVAYVGAGTALLAASIGMVQDDIKKVLAYSTVSQLGFMFAALGIGAFSAGLFHTMTHAFFKALLFLAAGSVIHGMHHQQNIKKMGNLRKYMPTTYWTFLIGTMAIAGIPFFSGFFSKDEILWQAYNTNNLPIYVMLVIAAIFTAFYMFRLLYLTFHGKERFDASHHTPHESPKSMTFVLISLAGLAALGGFLNVPFALYSFLGLEHVSFVNNWLAPIFADANTILGISALHELHAIEYILMAVATALAVISWMVAKNWYLSDSSWSMPGKLVAKFPVLYKTLLEKWYLDNGYYSAIVEPLLKGSKQILWRRIDVGIVDGIVNGLGTVTKRLGNVVRRMQTGIAQTYATVMVLGILLIIFLMVF